MSPPRNTQHAAPSNRRAMWTHDSIEVNARQTQAARDALRRRQKEKKARNVKRHVMYKQRKRLLDQHAADDVPAPIVAPELGAPMNDDDDDEYDDRRNRGGKRASSGSRGRMRGKKRVRSDSEGAGQAMTPKKEGEEHAEKGALADVDDTIQSAKVYNIPHSQNPSPTTEDDDNNDDDHNGDSIAADVEPSPSAHTVEKAHATGSPDTGDNLPDEHQEVDGDYQENADDGDNFNGDEETPRPAKRNKKFEPFAKERQEYENWCKQREEEQREHAQRVKERENMLRTSRRKRRAKSQQYRKKTKYGQPKLKHTVENLLAKVQQQRNEEN